jgi:hypothetical protein
VGTVFKCRLRYFLLAEGFTAPFKATPHTHKYVETCLLENLHKFSLHTFITDATSDVVSMDCLI